MKDGVPGARNDSTPDAPGLPSKPNILVVDDESLSRCIVSTLLIKCNYKVTCASSAREAVGVLESTEPDTFHLILTSTHEHEGTLVQDVVMPSGGDGLDLLETIQADRRWRHIPVVMMSANDRIQTVRECLQRGASHYILKPVTKKEVQNIWQHAYHPRVPPRPASGSAHVPRMDSPPVPPAGKLPEAARHAAAPRGPPSPASASSADAPPVTDATLASGFDVPLNALLEARAPPWPRRLGIFCQLLHLSHTALAAGRPPFSAPASVRVSLGGDSPTATIDRSAPVPHPTTTYYAPPPTADAAPALGGDAARAEATCVYALGVLLLELASPPAPAARRAARLAALPALPPQLLTLQPAVAVLILRMTAAAPDARPSLAEVAAEAPVAAAFAAMRAALSGEARDGAALDLAFQFALLRDTEALQMRRAQDIASALSRIDGDLAAVQGALDAIHSRRVSPRGDEAQLREGGGGGDAALVRERAGSQGDTAPAVPCISAVSVEATCSNASAVGDSGAALKRAAERSGSESPPRRAAKVAHAPPPRDASKPDAAAASPPTPTRVPEAVRRRYGRIEPLFKHFFRSYRDALAGGAAGLTRAAELGDAVGTLYDGGADGGAPQLPLPPRLAALAGNLHAASRYARLDVCAALQHNASTSHGVHSRKMVCSVALDRAEETLATAGVNKSIRIYRFADLVAGGGGGVGEVRYPVQEMTSRSKLSCACFNPYVQHRLAVSDFEGTVQVWDTQRNVDIATFDEHSDRVWSIDCSPLDPARLVSASLDTSVRLWDAAAEASVGLIECGAQACSAAFCPDNANLLAVGTAACETRLYDVRRLDAPLATAAASRAVSYVRFLGTHLVSSVVNSTLQLLDVRTLAAGEPGALTREFTGHTNLRHFVGLAVTAGGYLFTGSETNEVAMYHKSTPHVLGRAAIVAQEDAALGGQSGEKPIVSCIAVGKSGEYVVAGGTTGWVNVMKLA